MGDTIKEGTIKTNNYYLRTPQTGWRHLWMAPKGWSINNVMQKGGEEGFAQIWYNLTIGKEELPRKWWILVILQTFHWQIIIIKTQQNYVQRDKN